MSASMREALSRMAVRYSHQFRVPLSFVETKEILGPEGEEDGEVWALHFPKWTVGASLARAIARGDE